MHHLVLVVVAVELFMTPIGVDSKIFRTKKVTDLEAPVITRGGHKQEKRTQLQQSKDTWSEGKINRAGVSDSQQRTSGHARPSWNISKEQVDISQR